MLGWSATTEAWTGAPVVSCRLFERLERRVLGVRSRVSWTLPPLPDLLDSRSTSLLTNSRSSSPERTSFWLRSMPVWSKNEK